MNTYHPFDWTQLPVNDSSAFPLEHRVVLNPEPEWWTLPQLNTEWPLEREIALTLRTPRRLQQCAQSPVTDANYAGYYQIGPYRFFITSSLLHDRIIGPVVEHFPPGADTWPDNIKPQFRVPEEMQRPATAEPVLPDCPTPVVDTEDSRDWPIIHSARVDVKGVEVKPQVGQPSVSISAIAKVDGSAAVVDTGSIEVVASIVVGLKDSRFDSPILNLLKQVQSERQPLQVRITRPTPIADFEVVEFTNAVAHVSGVGVVARAGLITGLVGPDLDVVEDEELLFLLEVA